MADGESVWPGTLWRGPAQTLPNKRGGRSVRGLRRLIFVLVVVGLLAAVPLSAVASESIISNDVRQAEAAFNQSLVAAVRGGLDKGAADTMIWRYTQVS